MRALRRASGDVRSERSGADKHARLPMFWRDLARLTGSVTRGGATLLPELELTPTAR
jgi:hypothetical protein